MPRTEFLVLVPHLVPISSSLLAAAAAATAEIQPFTIRLLVFPSVAAAAGTGGVKLSLR